MNKKRTDNFDKFSNKKKGAAVKEEYRQEKKKAKLGITMAKPFQTSELSLNEYYQGTTIFLNR